MSLGDALRLELRVAFSRRAQPIWFRALKWAVVVAAVWRFWRAPHFWWGTGALVGLAVAAHLVWRTKTKRWTRAWGGWSDLEAGRPPKRPGDI